METILLNVSSGFISLNNSGYAIFAIYNGANPEPKGEVPMVEYLDLIVKTLVKLNV